MQRNLPRAVRDFRSGDEDSPMRHMRGIGHDYSHMPIDARPAVPPAVRLRGIVHAYCQDVAPRKVQVRREVENETGVSVGVHSQFAPVEINSSVLVDAVELDTHSLPSPLHRRAERLAVPPCACRKEAAARTSWIVLIGHAFNAPVVRQIDCAPGPIWQVTRFGAARVAEQKFPVGVRRQLERVRLLLRCGHRSGRKPRQDEADCDGSTEG